MRKVLFLAILVSQIGCAERLVIRSNPPGAQVILDGQASGTTPMVYSTRDPKPMTYRIELEGLPPAEGEITTRLGPGRLVGAIFTLGIVAACRPLQYFVPNPLDVDLGGASAQAPPVALLRLYNVKSASVLSGECTRENRTCWIMLQSGERCAGDYIRENQGTTTQTTTNQNTGGYGVTYVPGVGVGSVGYQQRNSVVGQGVAVANVTQGVAVLRCQRTIIDCKLTLDAFGMQGHGECTDTQGQAYRATLLPGSAGSPQ